MINQRVLLRNLELAVQNYKNFFKKKIKNILFSLKVQGYYSEAL